MALVAYDYSDDSEIESESDGVLEPTITANHSLVHTKSCVHNISDQKITSAIPASSSVVLTSYSRNHVENEDADDDEDSEDDDVPVNISFSSLSKPQYDSLYVDESKIKSSRSEIWKKLIFQPRKIKPGICSYERNRSEDTNAKPGLLSMLPSPAHESTKSTKITIPNTMLLPSAVKNKLKLHKQEVEKADKDDDDENSDSENDFFSLSKVDEVKEYDVLSVDLDIAIEDSLKDVDVPKKSEAASDVKPVSQLDKYLHKDKDANEDETANISETNSDIDSQSHIGLDEDAMLKLCGRKRKGQPLDDVQVIDIHEDAILAETRKNLTKRLTEEVSYRPMRAGGPSSLSKRKHQITYLAFQAKERELELKNQWANNRFTRKQTQSKYGF